MFRDAYQKLDALETENLLVHLNPLVEGSPYKPSQTTVLAMALPFYAGYRLLDITDHSVMPQRRAVMIHGKDKATPLDWTNAPIYKLNEVAPLALDERNIVDYVRFFFSFVRGRHGRFLIVENVDDIAWKEEPPANARKTIGGLIEPVRLQGIDADGSYALSVRMIFKDSLFKGTITVTKTGLVTLRDEELVVEDIPVVDDVFGQ